MAQSNTSDRKYCCTQQRRRLTEYLCANRTCSEGLADGLFRAVLIVSVMTSDDREEKHAAAKGVSQ